MNYSTQPKKMLIPNLLKLLREYSGSDNRLSQKEMLDILKRDYDLVVDRKTLARNLAELVDAGYPIMFDEIHRPGVGEGMIRTNWYLERDFEDSELRLLIDSLLFSKHIPYSQCKELITKLEGLSNKYFKAKVKHIMNLPENQPSNAQLFYVIDILDEAISKGKKIAFQYLEYGIDKKRHPKLKDSGEPRRYVVNPFQMVATNGRYYLIGNYDKYDNISHYRLDRIADIELLNEPTKAKKDIPEIKCGLNLPVRMAEHIYMFGGPSVRAKFRTPAWLADQIIDWFGLDVELAKDQGDAESGDLVIASVKVNEKAFKLWALQYGMYVEVLEPTNLRAQIKDEIKRMDERYGE